MWALDTITLRWEVLIYAINLAVIASLVCGLNLLAGWFCRKRSAPLKYTILATGLALILLCPAAAWIGQQHGPGFIKVRLAGQPPSLGKAAIEQSKSVSTSHRTTVQPVEPSRPEPLVLGLPADPKILPKQPSAEVSAGGDSSRTIFHLSQTAAPDVAPVGTLGTAAGTPVSGRTVENRRTTAWWQLAGTLALYAWVLGAAVGAYRMARGYRSVFRLRRSLRPVLDARTAVIAHEAAGALGLRKSPPVMTSAQLPVPISLGVWRPVVVLPENMAREMEKTQLTAVLLHEMAHIARRDHLTGLAQRLALILFWWNSLLRRLSRRISELREEICDNYVLQVQGGGAPLARVLIEMADRAVIGPRLPVAVGMSGPELDGLGRRISRLVNKEPNMATRMNFVGSAAVFLCGAAALLGIACVGSLHAFQEDAAEAAPPEQSEGTGAENQTTGDGFFAAFAEDPKARVGVAEKSPKKRPESKRRAKDRSSTEANLEAVYQTDFRGGKFDRRMLMPYGFDTLYGLQLLKPEPRGLRVVIPHHQGRIKPSVGLLPLLNVQGDFEITASCELLATETPTNGVVAGASLYILAEETLHGAVLRRGVDVGGGHVYFVSHTIQDDDGKRRPKVFFFPAVQRSGQLRLARKGTVLQFLVAEEDSQEFRNLHEIEFGNESIGLVRLGTTTDGSPTSAETMWKDLTIRAEQLKPANVPLFGTSLFDDQGPIARTYVEPPEPRTQWPGLRVFDPFEGHLALDWKPVRPDPTHVSLTKNAGKLTITTQGGGIWENTGNEARNLHVIRNPMADDADFVMTTCIESFKPTMKWQQAGLLVYDDDDNYLKCAMECGEVNPRLAFIREADGDAKSDIDQTGVETEKIWIRIIKRGNRYERAYSIDGRKFVSADEGEWGNGAPKWLGVFAKNGLTETEEIDAAFDFFEVRSLTPAEKTHRSALVADAETSDAEEVKLTRGDETLSIAR